MTPNELDIHLLNNDPGRLIVRYQPLVKVIVRQFISRGYGQRKDFNDLVQEINRRLLERIPRIRQLYNQKSMFKTYFSVVIRNLYLEEVRRMRLVAEPDAEAYYITSHDHTLNGILVKQEHERLRRAISLFGSEAALLWLCLRALLDQELRASDLEGFSRRPDEDRLKDMLTRLAKLSTMAKSARFNLLAEVAIELGEKERNGEALRKWFNSRVQELISMMNGHPPKSAYSLEIIQILMEKFEVEKNVGPVFPI